jgi:hypothetical protein
MAERAAVEPGRRHRPRTAGVEDVHAERLEPRDLGVAVLGQERDVTDARARSRERRGEPRRLRVVHLRELDQDRAPSAERGRVVVDGGLARERHLVEGDVLERVERAGAEVAREALRGRRQVLDDVADVVDHRVAATQRNVLRIVTPPPCSNGRIASARTRRTRSSPAASVARAPPAEQSRPRTASSMLA